MTTLTATLKVLRNVGEDMVWEAKVGANKIATSADVIAITACSAVASADKIKLLSATNVTDGVSLINDITYYPGRTFKINRSTIQDPAFSSDEVRIEFSTVSG